MDFRGFVANMAESASAQQLHSLQDMLEGDGLVRCNNKIFLETLAVGKQQSCMRTDGGGNLSYN